MILGHNSLVNVQEQYQLVHPCQEDTIREAGLDLRIARHPEDTTVFYQEYEDVIVLYPRKFALALTQEVVHLPKELIGFCNLRSSLARRGILIPPTIVDPGFSGKLVIELVNMSESVVTISIGTRFLHLIIAECVAAVAYAGQYQGQFTESK